MRIDEMKERCTCLCNISTKDGELGEPIWVDGRRNEHKIHEIDDRYLLNILGALVKGKGWTEYNSPNVIRTLFDEARKRGLRHDHSFTKAIKAYHAKVRNEEIMEEIINDNLGARDFF